MIGRGEEDKRKGRENMEESRSFVEYLGQSKSQLFLTKATVGKD